MIDYTWKNTDPRLQVGKFARIVILRPSHVGGGVLEASMARVETKHAYCVFTDFEVHPFVGEDEEWDEVWWWTWAPELST